MLTAMLAVRTILGEMHDVWSVNADCEYHEETVEVSDIRASKITRDPGNGLPMGGRWGGGCSGAGH